MQKRTIKIGSYNTAEHGWTLAALKLSDAVYKQNYVEKTGGDGAWDLSTAMTGGIPRYSNRQLTVSLECSKGDREHREKLINDFVNQHDGLEQDIVLPDRPEHYLHGRITVAVEYSDLAHARITITSICEPWLYSAREKVTELTANVVEQTVLLCNDGRRAVVPVLTVDGSVKVSYGLYSTELGSGSYEWPALLLTPGQHSVKYSGNGSLKIAYREAVLR